MRNAYYNALLNSLNSFCCALELKQFITENNLQERAKRGSRLKYEAILAKVPDVEPEAYDRIPTV